MLIHLLHAANDTADAASPTWWQTYGTVAGVAIGAILTAVLNAIYQLVVASRTHRMAQQREAASMRQSEYFKALDVTHDMEGAISDFGSALSGRYEPDKDDSSPEAEAQTHADEDSARAVDALFEHVGELNRSVLHIEAVGSPKVQKVMQELDSLLSDYMSSQFQEPTEFVFLAAPFNEMRESFRALRSKLAKAIRSDLKIDKIYRSK
jgi:hypothetical protein